MVAIAAFTSLPADWLIPVLQTFGCLIEEAFRVGRLKNRIVKPRAKGIQFFVVDHDVQIASFAAIKTGNIPRLSQ